MSLIRSSIIAVALLATIVTPQVEAQSANPYVSWYQDGAGAWRSNCTFWAWQRWFDVNGEALPSWGNAGEWAANAASAGYPVDNRPAVGSIVMTWESPIGHVAFVEAIDPNDPNAFLISEYGFAIGSDYHERWLTTDGSLLFIHPVHVASSVSFPGDGTAGSVADLLPAEDGSAAQDVSETP